MAKMVIKDCNFSGNRLGAIRSDNPETELEIEGTVFEDHPVDIYAPNGLKRLDMKDCEFDPPVSRQQRRAAERKQRKYFSGFSFSKGDHLK